MPEIIIEAGDAAGWRYLKFFAVNFGNDSTRRAYARACRQFFAWCENRGLTLATIRPFDVGVWVRELQQKHGAPGAKQQLAAVRMLFDWLVTGQVVSVNPAAAMRGPKRVVNVGTMPVLYKPEWRKLFDSISTETVRDLRDRALIGTLIYSFASIRAALKMKIGDIRPRGTGWEILLHEKGGKEHTVDCDHELAALLHAYVAAAGIAEDRKGWLFRTSPGHNATTLTGQAMNQWAAWDMIRRRAAALAAGRIGGRRKKLDTTARREIAESVISGRKTGADMARLYNISAPTVSRIVAAHRAGLAEA